MSSNEINMEHIFEALRYGKENDYFNKIIETPKLGTRKFNSQQIEKIHPIFSQSPNVFHVAAFYGQFDMIFDIILQTDPNNKQFLFQKDDQGRSISHFAAAGGQVGIIKLLYDFSHSPLDTDQDKEGYTYVHYACKYGHLKIVKFAQKTVHEFNTFNQKYFELAFEKKNLPIIDYICKKAKSRGDFNSDVDYDWNNFIEAKNIYEYTTSRIKNDGKGHRK